MRSKTSTRTVDIGVLATRYSELEAAVDAVASRVATAGTVIARVAAMAELASLEQESARIDPLIHGDDEHSRVLAAELHSSAWLLKMVAFTEDAPFAQAFLADLDLAEAGLDHGTPELTDAAMPHLRILAATADPDKRAAALEALADAVRPVAGNTTAETAAWLAHLARDRAGVPA